MNAFSARMGGNMRIFRVRSPWLLLLLLPLALFILALFGIFLVGSLLFPRRALPRGRSADHADPQVEGEGAHSVQHSREVSAPRHQHGSEKIIDAEFTDL